MSETALSRRWFFDTKGPVPVNIDEVFVAFAVEALGYTMAQMTRTPETMQGARPEERIPHAASSANMETIRRWRYDAGNDSVLVERTFDFFPGDVNEPPRSSELIRVEGKRRDATVLVLYAGAFEEGISMDVFDDELLERATRAFGAVTLALPLPY